MSVAHKIAMGTENTNTLNVTGHWICLLQLGSEKVKLIKILMKSFDTMVSALVV